MGHQGKGRSTTDSQGNGRNLMQMKKNCCWVTYPGDTATPGISDEERAIRLGRALDANVMRYLGAYLYASQE